jgi:hypothetical protein
MGEEFLAEWEQQFLQVPEFQGKWDHQFLQVPEFQAKSDHQLLTKGMRLVPAFPLSETSR